MSTDKNLLKRKVLTGIYWTFLERSSVQLMQVVVQIILARLLLPADFGVVAIVMVFIYLADILVQSGFSTALIQKQNTHDLDYSSVFFFSLGLSIVIYAIIYFISPNISSFYNMPILAQVLPILAIVLFPNSLNSVQIAYVKKRMNFNILFKCNLIAIIISSVISITMALINYGIWALVIQKLVYQFSVSILLLFYIEWKPSLYISFNRLKEMYSYGVYILGVSLIERIYTELFNLLIGKMYGANSLAYYNRGQLFPVLVSENINDGTQTVMFPALSSNQDNIEIFKNMTSRSLKTISLILVPLLMGLFIVSKNLIIVLLTEKWLPCLYFMQVSCIKFLFYPIYSANIQTLKTLGKSKMFFNYVICHKIIVILGIFIIYKKGINMLILVDAITFMLYSLISAIPSIKYINYGFIDQIKDLFPIYIISITMSIFMIIVQYLKYSPFITLLLQSVVGCCIFILLAHSLKLESYVYVRNVLFRKYFKFYNV